MVSHPQRIRWVCAGLSLALAAAAGCARSGVADVAQTSVGQDTASVLDTQGEVPSKGDALVASDAPVADAAAFHDAAFDDQGSASDAGPIAPVWLGKPCTAVVDCGGGPPEARCVWREIGAGKVCAIPCAEGCPDGWYCTAVTKPQVCLPMGYYWPVCLPCSSDEDCLTGTNYCVNLGEKGGPVDMRCSGYPGADTCPAGLRMRRFRRPGGDMMFLCAPKSGSCACFDLEAGELCD